MGTYWILVYRKGVDGGFELLEKTPVDPGLAPAMYLYQLDLFGDGVASSLPEGVDSVVLDAVRSAAWRYVEGLSRRLGANCREVDLESESDEIVVLEAYLCSGRGGEHLVAAALAPDPPRRVRLPS